MSEQRATVTRQRNRGLFDGPFGSVYSFYIEHEPVSRVVARAVWGADIRPFYESMSAIGTVADDGVIADVPCGAGPAFRGLSPDQPVRYLALDLSATMLERARTRAQARGLGQIDFQQGNAESVPLDDATADLFLSYWGLHCFANPEAAIAEARRCLRPGGQLVGGAVVRGASLRQRLLVRPNRGAFGAVPSAADVRGWLDGRFDGVRVERSGAFAYFRARAPASG